MICDYEARLCYCVVVLSGILASVVFILLSSGFAWDRARDRDRDWDLDSVP